MAAVSCAWLATLQYIRAKPTVASPSIVFNLGKRLKIVDLLSPFLVRNCAKGVNRILPSVAQQCNNWALGVYKQWARFRNPQSTTPPGQQCPVDLLECQHPLTVIDSWMAAFVLEVRRCDGEYYPPSTLKGMVVPGIETK